MAFTNKISDEVILDAAIKAGFSPSEAVTMLAIALAESSGYADAHNPRNEDSRGLWQINVDPNANDDLIGMDLYDPYENAKAAKIIYDRQSISAWTVTHNNDNARYLAYRDRALAAAQSAGLPAVSPNWNGVSGYRDRAVAYVDTFGMQDATYGSAGPGTAFPGSVTSAQLPRSVMDPVVEGYETQQAMEDAWTIAQQMLTDYGLESLFDEVYGWITTGRSVDTALGLMRETDEYKERFKGIQDRIDNGYNAITPTRYLELEDNYKNMMAQAGFDESFIEDYSVFIANDVNENEFSERISVAMQAAEAADPLILEELKNRFGIGVDTKADIAMYFLDPERAVTILEAKTQLGVAELSAATTGAIGGRLGTSTARKLVGRGYSARELAERLKDKGTFRQRMLGEQARGKRGGPLSSTQLAAAEFGLDSEAVARLKLLTQRRQQRGVSTSGAAITSSGVTGFGSAT